MGNKHITCTPKRIKRSNDDQKYFFFCSVCRAPIRYTWYSINYDPKEKIVGYYIKIRNEVILTNLNKVPKNKQPILLED